MRDELDRVCAAQMSVIEVPHDGPQNTAVISEPVVHPPTTVDFSNGCPDITLIIEFKLAQAPASERG